MDYLKYTVDGNGYSGIFPWGNSIAHFEKAHHGLWKDRIIHTLIAITEALPLIGQIASLFEIIIVKSFKIDSKSNFVESIPDFTNYKNKHQKLPQKLEELLVEANLINHYLSIDKLMQLSEEEAVEVLSQTLECKSLGCLPSIVAYLIAIPSSRRHDIVKAVGYVLQFSAAGNDFWDHRLIYFLSQLEAASEIPKIVATIRNIYLMREELVAGEEIKEGSKFLDLVIEGLNQGEKIEDVLELMNVLFPLFKLRGMELLEGCFVIQRSIRNKMISFLVPILEGITHYNHDVCENRRFLIFRTLSLVAHYYFPEDIFDIAKVYLEAIKNYPDPQIFNNVLLQFEQFCLHAFKEIEHHRKVLEKNIKKLNKIKNETNAPLIKLEINNIREQFNKELINRFKFNWAILTKISSVNKKKHTLLPNLLLARLIQKQILNLESPLLKKLENVVSFHFFRDGKHMRLLLQLLQSLIIISSGLENEDIANLLEALVSKLTASSHSCKKETFKMWLRHVPIVLSIMKMAPHNLSKANLIKYDHNFDAILLQIFQDKNVIADLNTSDGVLELINHPRYPMALAIYASRFDEMEGYEKERKKELFSLLLKSLAQKEFYKLRYCNSENRHFKFLFDSLKSQLQYWISDRTHELVDYIDNSVTELKTINIAKIMYQQIILDHHLDPLQYHFLADYIVAKLNSSQDKANEIKNNLHKEMLRASAAPAYKLQALSIRLIDSTPENLIKNLLEIENFLEIHASSIYEANDFKSALKSMSDALLKKSKNSYKDLKIVFSDDAWDLFLSGTEIEGSCQRIDGNPRTNSCLLSYVMDGKNKIIAIKNKSNEKIISRSIIRLLWDAKNARAVVFLERIYPSILDVKLEFAIKKLAKEIATSLNMPLLSAELTEHKYEDEIESLGNNLLFEYCDAKGLMYKNGIFKIENSYYLT